MSILYDRPDGEQRSVTVSLTDHEWGKLGQNNACLLRFQFDFRYGRDQRFKEAEVELSFTCADGQNPEIKNYGPAKLESAPTTENHVNSTTGEVAVGLPSLAPVDVSTTLGTSRESSWTEIHSGKVQGHRKLQKGSKVYDALSFQLEEDGRAKAGVPRIVRAAVVVETSSEFTISVKKPWTNPGGFTFLYKARQVNEPKVIAFQTSERDFATLTSDDWNRMVLFGSGPSVSSGKFLRRYVLMCY